MSRNNRAASEKSLPETPDRLPLTMTQLDRLNRKQKRLEEKELYYAGEVGAAACVVLNEQREQLQTMEKEEWTQMDEVERLLTELEMSTCYYVFCHCCGFCQDPCNKKSTKDRGKWWKNWGKKEENIVSSQPQPKISLPPGAPRYLSYAEPIRKVTRTASENETEQNVKHISDAHGNIRNMELDKDGVIAEQNHKIDRIADKVEETGVRINSANKRLGKLLHERCY